MLGHPKFNLLGSATKAVLATYRQQPLGSGSSPRISRALVDRRRGVGGHESQVASALKWRGQVKLLYLSF